MAPSTLTKWQGPISPKEAQDSMVLFGNSVKGIAYASMTLDQLELLTAKAKEAVERHEQKLIDARRFRPSYTPKGVTTKAEQGAQALLDQSAQYHRMLVFVRNRRRAVERESR